MVITTSVISAANKLYPPGEWAPYPFEAKPAANSKPGLPLAMRYNTSTSYNTAQHLRNDVW